MKPLGSETLEQFRVQHASDAAPAGAFCQINAHLDGVPVTLALAMSMPVCVTGDHAIELCNKPRI